MKSKPPEVDLTLGGGHFGNYFFLDFPVIDSITIL
jgi:hypothetical protein